MKELTEQLKNLIEKEADKKVLKIKGNVEQYKNFIDGFIETLESFEKDGRQMLKDCKEDKLKFSEVEAEGFLRGIITVKNQLKEDLRWLD